MNAICKQIASFAASALASAKRKARPTRRERQSADSIRDVNLRFAMYSEAQKFDGDCSAGKS